VPGAAPALRVAAAARISAALALQQLHAADAPSVCPAASLAGGAGLDIQGSSSAERPPGRPAAP
jgi:hypothetical protein